MFNTIYNFFGLDRKEFVYPQTKEAEQKADAELRAEIFSKKPGDGDKMTDLMCPKLRSELLQRTAGREKKVSYTVLLIGLLIIIGIGLLVAAHASGLLPSSNLGNFSQHLAESITCITAGTIALAFIFGGGYGLHHAKRLEEEAKQLTQGEDTSFKKDGTIWN